MGKKILLADDSITIQKVIELTFSDEDFEVVTVGNGRLAVERVVDARPDIVLCDIIMPEKDGYEVCDFIKRNPQLSRVPVLLLTGAFEPFDQERAARVGCDGFLAKPFEPETLIAKVKDLLQKAAARSSSVTGPQMAVQVPSSPVPLSVPAPVPPPPVAVPPPPPVVAAPPSPPPPVVVTPMPPSAPPQPQATASFDLPPRDPLPFGRPAAAPAPAAPVSPPPPEEVSFIPDEPFDDLDGADFPPPPAPVAASAPPPAPEPAAPAAPAEPEVYSVPDELTTEPEELLQMTPEESESLAAPSGDSSSTVVFRPGAMSWAQQPTIEVPLEARAQASVESAQASGSPIEDDTVFEEVLEEEVESLVGAEPSPAPESPSLSSTTVAVGMVAIEPPAPPPPPSSIPVAASAPVHAPVEEPPAAFAPEPLEVEPAPAPLPAFAAPRAPEPVVPALESMVPEPFAPASEPSSAIESFASVATPSPEAARGPSTSADVSVPNDMVAQIAQRVVAQISEKVVRQIAWEVIPDLAEGLIKKEIERLKAELQET